MNIRAEKKADIDGIWQVNADAFATTEEAELVNALRDSGVPYISLIYEKNSKLVGHILFTAVELVADTSGLKLMGLAPMAVSPKLQRSGIGTSLIKSGIQQCIDHGYDAIVVLGHPNYYPKFGFVPSVQYAITTEYDVAEDVFMALEIKAGALTGKKGTIKYHPVFGSV